MDRNEQITNMEDFEIKNGVLVDYNGKGGNVVIPDSVIEIGDCAFQCCRGITSINIPDSVTVIGYGAFCGCNRLTLINIPDSVTKIDGYVFDGCISLTSITIPDSVKVIGSYAFEGCSGLTSINIPDSITEIGEWAFCGCINLTSINIPDSVTKIGDCAFYACNGLTSINIPDSVTEIGWGAFKGCSNLSSINIPDSMEVISDNAFSGTKIKRQPQGHIAYKGFRSDMTCRDFQYKERETYTCDKAKLCECGFHACLNPLDCFDYYAGDDVVYHEVILEDRSDNVNDNDSKVCGRKITIGRRLSLQEMISIFNELNK